MNSKYHQIVQSPVWHEDKPSARRNHPELKQHFQLSFFRNAAYFMSNVSNFSSFNFVFQSRCDVSTQQATNHSTRFRLLEERNRALKLEVTTLRQEKQQYRKLVIFLYSSPLV